MARLTKADRRKAALKGWRKRARSAPKRRRNAPEKGSTSTASRTRTATSTKATTAGNKTSTSTGGASTSGGNVSITVKHNPARRNAPKGFIPCRAVKITRNRGGGVEVRIKRR